MVLERSQLTVMKGRNIGYKNWFLGLSYQLNKSPSLIRRDSQKAMIMTTGVECKIVVELNELERIALPCMSSYLYPSASERGPSTLISHVSMLRCHSLISVFPPVISLWISIQWRWVNCQQWNLSVPVPRSTLSESERPFCPNFEATERSSGEKWELLDDHLGFYSKDRVPSWKG